MVIALGQLNGGLIFSSTSREIWIEVTLQWRDVVTDVHGIYGAGVDMGGITVPDEHEGSVQESHKVSWVTYGGQGEEEDGGFRTPNTENS